MTREDANRYMEAINRAINSGKYGLQTMKGLKLLIKEYGLYYDEKPVDEYDEYKDINVSIFLSQLLEKYIILGEYKEGKGLFKTRGTEISHFLMPDEICEALRQKLKQKEQREKEERQAQIEEEVTNINKL